MEETREYTNKEYHIKSFEQLVNIANKDNIGDLSISFMMWLGVTIDIANILRESGTLTAAQKKQSTWKLLKPTFIWIDDGKEEISKVVITDIRTGEQTTVEAKIPKE